MLRPDYIGWLNEYLTYSVSTSVSGVHPVLQFVSSPVRSVLCHDLPDVLAIPHGRRPGRRHDGRADRGASGQRRPAGRCCSTSRATRPAQGLKRLRTLEAGSVLRAGRRSRASRRAASTTTRARLRDADWIIEAVVESLDVKQALLGRLAPHVGAGAVLSSNTSGIPLAVDRRRRCRPTCARAGSARTSSIRRDTCICSN